MVGRVPALAPGQATYSSEYAEIRAVHPWGGFAVGRGLDHCVQERRAKRTRLQPGDAGRVRWGGYRWAGERPATGV